MKDYVWVEQIGLSPLVDKWQHGDSFVFSLYYDTEINQQGSYSLKVPTGKVTKYVLNEDGEIPAVQVLNVTAGTINLEISEKPVFIAISG